MNYYPRISSSATSPVPLYELPFETQCQTVENLTDYDTLRSLWRSTPVYHQAIQRCVRTITGAKPVPLPFLLNLPYLTEIQPPVIISTVGDLLTLVNTLPLLIKCTCSF